MQKGAKMHSQKEIAEFLAKVPLFQGLNRRQRESLAKRFVERKYPADRAIVTQDKGGEGLFIVVSGNTVVMRERGEGEKVQVNAFGPSDFFGELALLDDGPRTASVITTEPTECLALTRWDFYGALRDDVDMAILILQEMARRFRIALDSL
jgi:CRP/FNR family cyclic AMP-dependent transcriptional regulator